MSNTTAPTSNANATFTYPLDYYYALFVNPVIVIRLYQIAYPITFLLGFIGNTASLITFSHSSLRKVSTGCLFITLAISDTLFLSMCIFDFVEFGLQVSFYRHVDYDVLCRFRSFIMYVSQVMSAWILVIISVDRWIRTRFPYKSGSICTPKKALLAVGVLLIIAIGLYSHILLSLYGMLIPGFSIVACGPTIYSGSYFIFYFLDWTIVQILVICLLPVVIMVSVLTDIFISVRIRKRAVVHAATTQQSDNSGHHQKNLQVQMFILMLTSVSIFLITTLPVGIYKITSPRQSDISFALVTVATIWTALGWLQSLNYAVNFYTHCLTSTLFRKVFRQQIRVLCGGTRTQVTNIDITATGHAGTRTHRY